MKILYFIYAYEFLESQRKQKLVVKLKGKPLYQRATPSAFTFNYPKQTAAEKHVLKQDQRHLQL